MYSLWNKSIFLNPAVILMLLSSCSSLIAQEKQTNYGNQEWIQYYNQLKINNNWSVLTDIGYRWKNEMDQRTQYIMRIGASYQIHNSFRFTFGFAHLGYYSTEKLHHVEYRPYQELLYQHHYKKIKFNHRFRIEERYFSYVDNDQNSTFNLRYRYCLMMNLPLVKFSNSNPNRQLLFNLGDELFINSGNVDNVFNQNRVLTGFTYTINNNFSVQITYNKQFSSTKIHHVYNQTDILWLGLKHKINLK